MDGNRKESTSAQTPSTAGNPAQTKPPSAPVDELWTEQSCHERQLQKPIDGSEQPKTQSPLSDSNRRPLPYHGRIEVLQAFTDALGRARNPCKQWQYGVYGCGGRDSAVLDLVDAEWTRAVPHSPPESPGLTGFPRRPAAPGLGVGPNTNERRTWPGQPSRSTIWRGVKTSNESCLWVDSEASRDHR